ncbi:MAG: translocation/assembly module TamB domain-containing protein [Pseudomonadota bacterium]
MTTQTAPLIALKTAAKTALATLLAILAVGIGVLLPALAYLSSGSGKVWLTKTIDSIDGVSLNAISGQLLGDLTLTGLALEDEDGVWLSIQSIDVDWQPAALLRRQVAVDFVSISKIEVFRAPQYAPAETDAEPLALADITDIPVSISIVNLIADEILWRPGQEGAETFSFAARAALERRQSLYTVAALAPVRSDRIDDEINADILINTRDMSGDVTLTLTAAKDGLIAALARLPDRTTAQLDAAGDIETWNAAMNAIVGGKPVVQLKAEYAAPRGTLIGSLDPSPFVSDGTADALSEPLMTNIQFEAKGNQRAAITGSIANQFVDLNLDGVGRNLDGILEGEDFRLKLTSNGVAGPATLDTFAVEALINGDTAKPDVRYSISARAIAADTITITEPRVSGQLNAVGDGLSTSFAGAVKEVAGIDAVSPEVLRGLSFEGQAAQKSTGLSAKLSAATDVLRFVLTDLKQDKEGTLTARGTLAAKTLVALPGALPAGLKAKAVVTFTQDGQMSANAGGELTVHQAGAHWASRLASKTLTFDIDAAMQDGFIRVSELEMTSDKLQVTGQASLSETRIDSSIKATLQPSAFADLAGTPINRPAEINLNLSGPIDQALPIGRIEIPAIAASGLEFRDLDFTLEKGEDAGAIKIALTGRSSGGPALLEGIVSRPGDGMLLVRDVAAKIANLTLTANAAIPIETDGDVSGSVTSSLYPAANGTGGLFGVSGRFDLVAKIDPQQPGMLSMAGEGPIIRYGDDDESVVSLSDVNLLASANLKAPDLAPTGTLTAKAIEAGGLFIDALTAQVSIKEQRPHFSVLVSQSGAQPTNLTVGGTVTTAAQATTIIAELGGIFGGATVSAASPLEISVLQNGVTLNPAEITIGDGRISLAASQTQDALKANIEVDTFDIAVISHFLQREVIDGTLDANASIVSSTAEQNVAANFTLAGLRTPSRTAADIGLAGKVQTANGRINTQITAGQSETPQEFNVKASVPIEWRAAPGLPAVLLKSPLEGRVDIDTRLGPWWALAALRDQTLAGTLAAEIDLSGTLERPLLDGQISLENGAYEHLEYGSTLKALTADIGLSGEDLQIKTLTANDGRSGTLNGVGGLSLATLEPSGAAITLNDFQVLAQNDLSARISANLDLAKAADQLMLEGDVTIEEARYAINTGGAATVATLPIEEVNSAFLSGAATADVVVPKQVPKNAAASSTPLALDINVKAPRRIFVTGMGLTSEWRTTLDIEGPADAPEIKGQVQVVRGELEFAGKRFNIERGQIYLDGGTEVEPRLDILAQNTQGDFTANIGITGTPSSPEISLSSNPSLPDDEILSRILFGTSATDLSALEAVQLGSAVAALSGGGGGALDIAGKARSLTGLDRLSLGSADSSTAITGGKYLSEDLYLQFTTDPSTGQYLAAIEWYLTRSLSLLSEYGPQTGSNVAGRWSKTY